MVIRNKSRNWKIAETKSIAKTFLQVAV